MSTQDPRAWDSAYSGARPAWDIGRPQPVLADLAKQGCLSGRVLDVGCGTGEHAMMAASHGCDALGVDLSPEAIRIAWEKTKDRDITARFLVADALNLGALGEVFDVVIDSGLFHVFDGDERARYADSLAEVVRPGGTVYITCICDQQPGEWGPHRVTEEEIRTAFSDRWLIEELSVCTRLIQRPEVHVWAAKAWLATIRRVGATTP